MPDSVLAGVLLHAAPKTKAALQLAAKIPAITVPLRQIPL